MDINIVILEWRFGIKIKCILALCVCLIFMVVSPAVAKDKGIRGIAAGWGEWAGFGDIGNTVFTLESNFPGNASGGYLLVSYKDGNYFLVEADPNSVIFLCGKWLVWDAEGNESNVSGYAMWAMGEIVDTSFDDLKDKWCVMGAYDGGKSSHKSDYLFANPGLDELGAGGAVEVYNQALDGDWPLWVEMVKGNVTLKVKDKKPCRKRRGCRLSVAQ